MRIGQNSYMNDTSYLLEKDGRSIWIGDNVAIGHFCYISTQMHCTDDHTKTFSGDIRIEDNVWIGNNVVIYPSVTIGHHARIGHSCTITHDVPPHSIVRVEQITYTQEKET